MKKLYLFSDIVFSVFYIYFMLTENTNIFFLLLLFLVCISIKTVLYMSEQSYAINVLSVCSVLFFILCSHFIFGFILFFSITILLSFFNKSKRLVALSLIISMCTLFVIDLKFMLPYILSSILLHLVSFIDIDRENRLIKLINENDELRSVNNKLKQNSLRAKLYETSTIKQSQLEERNNIAQRIHDEVGHTIAGSTVQLEAIKVIIDTHPEKAEKMINSVLVALRQGMDKIRGTLKEIKPELQTINISGLKVLITDFQNKTGINAQLVYNNDISILNVQQWQVTYINIQECLTNIMKYARAKNVVIRFELFNRFFKITVKDDGVGKEKIIKGLGLKGIEERTVSVGGNVILDGSDGFTVIIMYPVTR